MDYEEEQKQEIEILQSIYPDELTLISDTQFTITLLLETPSERKHRLVLHVTYPETYPEVAPKLDVTVGESIDDDDQTDGEEDGEEEDDDDDQEDEDEPKLVLISEQVQFDDDDLEHLRNKLIEEAEEQLGIPSVFALASCLKDDAEVLFEKQMNKRQKAYDDDLLAKEREEQKKFYGTKITPESFKEWRDRFRKEMGYDKRTEERLRELHHGKMTGKEIFEKGLANEEDTLDEVATGVSKIQV